MTLSGRSSGCGDYVEGFPRVIALLADRRIDAEPLISSRVALGDAIEHGVNEPCAARTSTSRS
jgi:threonine dehydrogenase-like Zn-dependent dehydrogenase